MPQCTVSGFALDYGQLNPTLGVGRKVSTAGVPARMSSASVSVAYPHAFQRARHPPPEANLVEQLIKNDLLVIRSVVVVQRR